MRECLDARFHLDAMRLIAKDQLDSTATEGSVKQ
jgi:hypothetical protein